MRELRRSADRYVTTGDGGICTHHSFSYGAHYDPDNVGFGALIATNTEQLPPGTGYDEHRHEDVEIVTWVLDGTLAHEDSTGMGGLIVPGTAQRLSAGSGAQHTERNGSASESLTFVQMMLRSTYEGQPQYASVTVPGGPGRHDAVPVQADARLEIVRPGDSVVQIEVERRLLVHVTRGTLDVDGVPLTAGDELRLTAPEQPVRLEGDGEALVWHLG